VRLLDLFSGIGGFSLGLERAGFRTVAFCEIAPSCRHLLATHWPDVPCFDDVTTLTGEMVGPVDAICGGFPCQDISFAGKGAGLAGERSGLWREYARLIGELRPRYVIVENVAALLGRGLGDVLGDLASLGYDAWWDCIPAAAVGAPHRRDRLWIVAYPGGVEHEGYGDALRQEIAAGLSRAAAAAAHVAHAESDGGRARLREHDPAGCRRALSGDCGSDVANTTGERRGEARGLRRGQSQERSASRSETIHAADTPRVGRLETVVNEQGPHRRRTGAGQPAGNGSPCGGLWSTEPDVGRVAHGVPARVDRLHGLGNAVVPQIPEIIGRAILNAERARQREAA
jgi:DNA (cytosine-5)-methyltransferase 1